MLVSRPRYLVVSAAFVLTLAGLFLLYTTRPTLTLWPQLGRDELVDPKTWVYGGPLAKDKVVVMAKIRSENASWVFENLQE
jgi:hypothetical protein